MRTQNKPESSSKDGRSAIDDTLLIGAGLAIIGVIGVLTIAYAWEAILLTAPL